MLTDPGGAGEVPDHPMQDGYVAFGEVDSAALGSTHRRETKSLSRSTFLTEISSRTGGKGRLNAARFRAACDS